MLPIVIMGIIISMIALGLIAVQESQSVAMTQKMNEVNAIHNAKEKETVQAAHSGSSFSFKNPENVPVHIKYFRIVDDQGNLITRIPYDKQIPAFTNSSVNLNGVIPTQYLK